MQIDWHVPSDDEISFALRLVREIGVPSLEALGRLLDEAPGPSSPRPTVWTSDFCRHLQVVKATVSGISSIARLPPPANPGVPISDAGDTVPSFIDQVPHMESCLCLTDPGDPRHGFVVDFRAKVGEMLHASVMSLKGSGAEDSIDCIKAIASTIRTVMLHYPCDPAAYNAVKRSYDFAVQITRTTKRQRAFPRFVWVRRANLYHASRLRLSSFYRKRSAIDDVLIADMRDLSLSAYVAVRKSAQRALDMITHYFDGTRTMIFDRMFEALQPGNEPDVMKGALYVLGTKMVQNLAIADWRFGPRYLLALLRCSHQNKPSVQSLVKSVLHDYIIRLAEPSTLKSSLYSPDLLRAADNLASGLQTLDDPELTAQVEAKARGRVQHKNAEYESLVPQLLAIASSSSTHWRYMLSATRLIRALIRRDQPLRADVAEYLVHQLISELPHQRNHSMLAMMKLLHFAKLRSLCDTDEKLLLQQSHNPLKRKVKLEHPLPEGFTDDFIRSFSEPLAKDT